LVDDKLALLEEERLLGRYMVAPLQYFPPNRWEASMMQLAALVTNYRLMLYPAKRRYQPACLPANYIKRTRIVPCGNFRSLQLPLSTGHSLYLTTATGTLEDLQENIEVMRLPSRVRFDDRETGTLRLGSEVSGPVEIVGVATGPAPLEHDLPAGVYEVGRVDDPASRRSVRVEPGAVREVTLGESGGGDDAVIWGVVLGAVGAALIGGAIGLGVALSDQGEPLTEPVFGIIATLTF